MIDSKDLAQLTTNREKPYSQEKALALVDYLMDRQIEALQNANKTRMTPLETEQRIRLLLLSEYISTHP